MATVECRPIANELLDVALHDLIWIMHDIVSGELRVHSR